MYKKLREQIKRHEGSVIDDDGIHRPYYDSEGVLTIGYGHNLEASPLEFTGGITEYEAMQLLDRDIGIAIVAVRDVLGFGHDNLDKARLAVLVDMAFNLGTTRLMRFKKFLGNLRAGHYPMAAYEMLNSKWARQVTNRAITLTMMMLSGDWEK